MSSEDKHFYFLLGDCLLFLWGFIGWALLTYVTREKEDDTRRDEKERGE
jgi:hypothetical protein